jgi:hypothetical protein
MCCLWRVDIVVVLSAGASASVARRPHAGRLVKGRLRAALVIIEGKRREAEDSALALRPLVVSQTARFEDGVSTVVSWLRPPIRPADWASIQSREGDQVQCFVYGLRLKHLDQLSLGLLPLCALVA